MRADSRSRAWQSLRRVASSLVLLLAALLLWRQLQTLRLDDVRDALHALPPHALLASAAATAASFLCLAALECVVVRDVLRLPIPAAVARRVGAVSHALSNTLGFHAVTAGLARYRGYRDYAPSAMGVTRILAIVGGAVVAGALLLAAAATVAQQAGRWAVPAMAAMMVASAVVLATAWPGRQARPPRTRRVIVLATIGWLALLDAGFAVLALHVLLPASGDVGLAHVALLFLGASVAGVASQSPGGIGVFEAAMLVALPAIPAATLLAALLAFRVVYNLLPFAIASLLAWVAHRAPGARADQLDGG